MRDLDQGGGMEGKRDGFESMIWIQNKWISREREGVGRLAILVVKGRLSQGRQKRSEVRHILLRLDFAPSRHGPYLQAFSNKHS